MENDFLNNDLQIDPDFKTSVTKESESVIDEASQIQLLEEKLVVKRYKHKIGEVVVRKEVETRMLHIPIRREKLIVEKVGVTTEHLTEVDLGEEQINGVKFGKLNDSNDIYQAQSNFISLENMKELLAKITNLSDTKNVKLRLEIITDRPESQRVCQDICDQS